MITQATAERIWVCYREIETAKNMLTALEAGLKAVRHSNEPPTPKDVFGRSQDYLLGIPSGENSHRLYSVRPQLALSVMRAHIAEKQLELCEANEAARIELEAP